jgi:hypothetical protein
MDREMTGEWLGDPPAEMAACAATAAAAMRSAAGCEEGSDMVVSWLPGAWVMVMKGFSGRMFVKSPKSISERWEKEKKETRSY